MNSTFKCPATADSFSIYSRTPHNCPYCRCPFSDTKSHRFQTTAPQLINHMAITFNPILSHFNYTAPSPRTRQSLNKTINFFYGSPNSKKPHSSEAKFSTKRFKHTHFPHLGNQVEQQMVLQIVKKNSVTKPKKIQNGQKTPQKHHLLKLNRVKSKDGLEIDSRHSKNNSQSNYFVQLSSGEIKQINLLKNSPINYFNMETTPENSKNIYKHKNYNKCQDSDLKQKKYNQNIDKEESLVITSIIKNHQNFETNKQEINIMTKHDKISGYVKEIDNNPTFAKISSKIQENTQKSVKPLEQDNQPRQQTTINQPNYNQNSTLPQPAFTNNFSENGNIKETQILALSKVKQPSNHLLINNNKYPTVKSIQVYEQPKQYIDQEQRKKTNSKKGSATSLKILNEQQNFQKWHKTFQINSRDHQLAAILSQELALNYDYYIINQDTDRSLSINISL